MTKEEFRQLCQLYGVAEAVMRLYERTWPYFEDSELPVPSLPAGPENFIHKGYQPTGPDIDPGEVFVPGQRASSAQPADQPRQPLFGPGIEELYRRTYGREPDQPDD